MMKLGENSWIINTKVFGSLEYFADKKKMLILTGSISTPGRKMVLPKNSGEIDLHFSSFKIHGCSPVAVRRGNGFDLCGHLISGSGSI